MQLIISIHALREEGDLCSWRPHHADRNFYPRPPRGGRLVLIAVLVALHRISIHALREEGDICSTLSQPANSEFLSTPSARRATALRLLHPRRPEISIHALREEGDAQTFGVELIHNDFYPRPPRGGRPVAKMSLASLVGFLSTPSARRATRGMRRGSPDLRNFYPRPPRGGRRHLRLRRAASGYISIHALREEGDGYYNGRKVIPITISIHALREEGDAGPARLIDLLGISIHALREEGDT